MLDIYLSSVSNRLNSVMESAYDHRYHIHAPHLHRRDLRDEFQIYARTGWRWGYPAVWLIVVIIGVSMLIYFKRKKWL